MSNAMVYKLIERKSINYFNELNIFQKLKNDKDKARIGFYYLSLELITGIRDYAEITKMIIDKDFVFKLNGIRNEDLGIDAVYIDDESNIINLFNFKYRDSFNKKSTLGTNEALLSVKFLSNICADPKLNNADFTVKFLKEINNRLEDYATSWTIKLYFISNDGENLNASHQDLQPLRNDYKDVSLKIISLNDFDEYFTIKPKNNTSVLILEANDILTYEESKMTTSKSYIVKLSLVELIKITSNDIDLRLEPKLERIEQFADLKLDRGILFDNVRGYLGDTDYNRNIVQTLEKEPEKFFLYNNGITVTVKQVEVNDKNMGKQYKIQLSDYQIVNGGQTLRSIYKYKDDYRDGLSNLVNANVLVRLFKTGVEEGLVNKIAEYTNSQNAISPIDLKSVDSIQIDLERNLKLHSIKYIRKTSVDPIEEKLDYSISMEKVGQLLLSFCGHPEKVSNQKKKIFSDYYNKLFVYDDELLEKVIKLTQQYFEIEKIYNLTNFNKYEQKLFYIIFINKYIDNIDLCINLLENSLTSFRDSEDVPESRKLIQIKFKDLLIEKIKKELGNLVEINFLKL